MAVKLRFKGLMEGNHMGVVYIQPDGFQRLVVEAILPLDGDWRADVEFYDTVESAYRTRLRKTMEQYQQS